MKFIEPILTINQGSSESVFMTSGAHFTYNVTFVREDNGIYYFTISGNHNGESTSHGNGMNISITINFDRPVTRNSTDGWQQGGAEANQVKFNHIKFLESDGSMKTFVANFSVTCKEGKPEVISAKISD